MIASPPRFLAWEGRSPLTGDPVVLVVTSGSTNEKTGPMWQAWLLHAEVAPFAAVKSGQDAAICETPRGLARIILALRQGYRRRGDRRSVRQHQIEPGTYAVRLS